jgi:hypothetical protein
MPESIGMFYTKAKAALSCGEAILKVTEYMGMFYTR